MAKLINGTITLYPTKTIISPYTERNPLLENSLNVWDKVNFDYKFQAFIRDVDSEENDRIILPTGFAPNYLLNMYPTYEIVDKRSSYEKYMEANRSKYTINMKYDCRNDIQRNALKFLNVKELRHRYKPMQRYLCLSTGVGKAQPISTIIPTPNGYRQLKELNIGDYVFNRYGKPVKITGIFPQGKIDSYKVTLMDDRITYCNDKHLWTVKYRNNKSEKTLMLKEIIDNGYLGPRNTCLFKIPNNKAVEFETKNLPIDPYVLGSLIGNGCFTEDSLAISSDDEFVVNKIGNILNKKPIKQHHTNHSWYFEEESIDHKRFKHKYVKTKNILNTDNFNLVGLKSKDKYIPEIYKLSSIEQRYSLLQGLFDTDGNIQERNRNSVHVSYSTVSKNLAYDIAEILRSLGISCSIHKDTHKNYNNDENCCYIIYVNCENYKKVDLFSLPRKKDIAIKNKNKIIKKNYDYIGIKSIEKMDNPEEMLCIMVDDEEHLYLTNDYIVTHNTFVTVKYIADNHERPIIFVDQEALGEQWIERIKEYTDTTDKEIYYISGRSSVNKIFNMSTDDILKIKFFICSYRTITNIILNDNNTNKIAELFTTMKVTLKVFDEAHVEYMSIFKMDMISNLRSIYLSATPMRSDPIEDKVYQNMFRQVERFYSKDKNDKTVNYHNILILKWDSKPSLIDQSYCLMKYGFSMAKYCDYILREGVYSKFENLMYAILFDTVLANRKKKKTAILFGTLKLLNVFYDNLTKYCEEKGFKLVINKFSGETKKEDRLDILDQTDIILTTDKSFGKAIDVKGLQVLINTVPFTSESKLTQTIGRLREIPNKEVTFIDINDIGFLPIRNHISIKKSKVYKNIAKNLFEKSI